MNSRAEEVTAQLLRPKLQFWLAKHRLPPIFCHLKFPYSIFIPLQVNLLWALFPSSRFNLFLLVLFSTDLRINSIIPCWHTKCQQIKLKCWIHHFPVAFWNDNKRHFIICHPIHLCNKQKAKQTAFLSLHRAVICVAESDQLRLHGEWRSKGKFTCLSCLLLIWIVATLSVALCHHPSEIRASYIFAACLFIEQFNKYIFFPWSPLFVCVLFCLTSRNKGLPSVSRKKKGIWPQFSKTCKYVLGF